MCEQGADQEQNNNRGRFHLPSSSGLNLFGGTIERRLSLALACRTRTPLPAASRVVAACSFSRSQHSSLLQRLSVHASPVSGQWKFRCTLISPPATMLTPDRWRKSSFAAEPPDGCACMAALAAASTPCTACTAPVHGLAWTSVGAQCSE